MGCLNCRCNKKKISEEKYNELKNYLLEEIRDYKLIDYINENNKPCKLLEITLSTHILEIEDINFKNLSLENIVEYIIINNII